MIQSHNLVLQRSTSRSISKQPILDMLTKDPVWLGWSQSEIARLEPNGLAINPIIYAELAPAFLTEADFNAARLLCKLKGWDTPLAETSGASVVAPEVTIPTIATPVTEGDGDWHWKDYPASHAYCPDWHECRHSPTELGSCATVEQLLAELQKVTPVQSVMNSGTRITRIFITTPNGRHEMAYAGEAASSLSELENLSALPPLDADHW